MGNPSPFVVVDTAQVVDGHEIRLRHEHRNAMVRDVAHMGPKTAQKTRQSQVIKGSGITPMTNYAGEVGRQAGKLLLVLRAADQAVVMFDARACESLDQIADVSTNAKIANAANVNRDSHILLLGRYRLRRSVALPLVQR